MGLDIKEFGSGVGYLKAGFYGMAGTGKTCTSTILAVGLKHYAKLPGRIFFFDTEGGAEYVNGIVKNGSEEFGVKATGQNIVGVRSRSFDDMMEMLAVAQKENAAAVIIDSLTHVWTELNDSTLKSINKHRVAKRLGPKTKLSFFDLGPVKAKWETFTTFFLNAPLHIIGDGRIAYEWAYEENDDGEKELRKQSSRMKTEKEMSHEPSLICEMERVQEKLGDKLGKRSYRLCTVTKDRFHLLDGKQAENPKFDFFLPHVARLVPGAANTIDTSRETEVNVDDSGDVEFAREKRQRQIFSEEFAGILTTEWPGQSAEDKRARTEVSFKATGHRSWTAIETAPSHDIKAWIEALPSVIAVYKAENPSKKKESA